MDARITAEGPVSQVRPREAFVPAALCVPVVLALLLTGCRVDPNIQLMEQELRLQDQRIFELEEHLSDCHEVVAAHRRDNASLKQRLEGDTGEGRDAADAPRAERRTSPEIPNGLSAPQVDEGDDVSGPLVPMDVAPPIEAGDAPAPLPQDVPTPAGGRPPEPADEAGSRGESSPAPTGLQSGQSPNELLPAPRLTGSADEIEQLGLRLAVRYHPHENLPLQVEALVEPQDAKRKQVLTGGDVSLMIIAANQQTQSQLGRKELARWEFSKNDAELLWSKSSLGTGLQFELPWPGSPQPGDYRLWVRLVGEDGRKHLGSVDFAVSEVQLARRPPPRVPSQEQPPADGPLLARTQDEPQEIEQPSAPPEVDWRRSTVAARLPQHNLTGTTSDLGGERAATDTAAADPWSPHRPLESGGSDATASSSTPQWSPHRSVLRQ